MTRSNLPGRTKVRTSSWIHSIFSDHARDRAFSSKKELRSTPVTSAPCLAKAMACLPGPQHKSKTRKKGEPTSFGSWLTCSSADANFSSGNRHGNDAFQNESSSNQAAELDLHLNLQSSSSSLGYFSFTLLPIKPRRI
jgi:hypothetical protein